MINEFPRIAVTITVDSMEPKVRRKFAIANDVNSQETNVQVSIANWRLIFEINNEINWNVWIMQIGIDDINSLSIKVTTILFFYLNIISIIHIS